jgi:molybdate transport system regulatory protein
MARLKISLILESGARIGPGKAALLESVRDTGSISAAARAMDMDYKRAWTLIDSLNRAFDRAVVERATGGSRGGGATLTPFGAEILAKYRRIEEAAAKLGAGDLKALERHALPDPGPKV